MKLHGTARVNGLNHLEIGGCDTVDIAKRYGTPLYVMDEQLIRENCREYRESFRRLYGRTRVAFAGKAFLNMAMCRIVEQEGLYMDVVSGGEIYTALKAAFPAERLIFHGNNKTPEELSLAIDSGVGRIVVDNLDELYRLDELSKEKGRVSDIYIRVTPGIEAHTHEYIRTGGIDSKFGIPVFNGQAMEAVRAALGMDNINLKGIHSHIGSQIFETQPYKDEVKVLFGLAHEIKTEFGLELAEIDLGGGLGIYYTEDDNPISKSMLAKAIASQVNRCAAQYGLARPCIVIEPGRSIVGNAGTTLYRIGAIKDIPGIRKYISADGGMADNIRPALYGAKYEAALANRMSGDERERVTIAGKCCESGDILIKDIDLPVAATDDILAVFTTGAYGQSMSSNYNRIPRPATVLVNKGRCAVICRRESYAQIVENDVIPKSMDARYAADSEDLPAAGGEKL